MLFRFHAILVGTGIVFCFAFALYQFFWPTSDRGPQVGALFAAGGVALSLYLKRFLGRGLRS